MENFKSLEDVILYTEVNGVTKRTQRGREMQVVLTFKMEHSSILGYTMLVIINLPVMGHFDRRTQPIYENIGSYSSYFDLTQLKEQLLRFFRVGRNHSSQ